MAKTQNNKQQTLPPQLKKNLTTGQKASDKLTAFVGSWKFIIGLFILLIIWMIINGIEFIFKPWDPYPFILLNFVLSCLAATQAPIILMSQNRTAERDRLRQEYDYLIDRKAERGIQELNKEIKSIKNYIKKIHTNTK